MYSTEVRAFTLPVEKLLADYCTPEKFAGACEACPYYGKVWSCPPNAVPPGALLASFSKATVVGVKVRYDRETREAASTPAEAEKVQDEIYGGAKQTLRETMLELERAFPGGWTIAAGRCEVCSRCARLDGLPCRLPERRRYSFSAFGFDLMRIAEELLDMPLLWSSGGLPEYQVALAAFLEPEGLELGRRFVIGPGRPEKLMEAETAGMLRRYGCTVRFEPERLRVDTFFDTASRAVQSRGCTLRLQVDDSCHLVWETARDPAAFGVRRKDVLPLEAGESIPEAVRAFLARHFRDLPDSIQPVSPWLVSQSRVRKAAVEDTTAGGTYELSFDYISSFAPDGTPRGTENRLSLIRKTGSGERLELLAKSLLNVFPELAAEAQTD